MSEGKERPPPDATCDGGDLDCGSGLLLIIRDAMQPLDGGGVLEVRSREGSVREDLPAWCRMVGHRMLGSDEQAGGYTSYLIRKKGGAAADDADLLADLESARTYAWTVRVRWTEGMAARAFVRNHSVEIGQPASFDTEDPAPSAIEHLLAAVGGCLAVGFQWRASRSGIEVRNLEVSLRARSDNILVFLGLEEDGHPGLAAVTGKLYVDCDGEDEQIAELWEQTVRRSPLAQSLLRATPVDVELQRT